MKGRRSKNPMPNLLKLRHELNSIAEDRFFHGSEWTRAGKVKELLTYPSVVEVVASICSQANSDTQAVRSYLDQAVFRNKRGLPRRQLGPILDDLAEVVAAYIEFAAHEAAIHAGGGL